MISQSRIPLCNQCSQTLNLKSFVEYLRPPQKGSKEWKIFLPGAFQEAKCQMGDGYSSHPVGPDVGVKSSPIFSKSCPKICKSV